VRGVVETYEKTKGIFSHIYCTTTQSQDLDAVIFKKKKKINRFKMYGRNREERGDIYRGRK
jgi:hypothetical protein